MRSPITFDAVDAAAEHLPLATGLHVTAVIDPLGHATHMTAVLGADMCTTPRDVDALLVEREAFPRLSRDDLEALRGLARRVAAAQLVTDRTVERAAVAVGERLAERGTGVAIHPSAVRERAAAVVTAREELQVAEQRLRLGEADVARAPVLGPDPAVPVSPAPPLPMPAPRQRLRLLPFGRRGRARREDEEDTSESTILLQQIAATTDEAFGSRRASVAQDQRLLLLRAQRDRREEELRVAERAWHDLAGEDSADDAEAVVRRFDPQLRAAVEVAQKTVGVRAVSTWLESALRAWEEAWRALGLDPPATVDQGEVERMVDQLARPVVLVAAAVAHAELVVLAVPAAPVLVIEGTS